MKVGGSDANDGEDWSAAFATVQHAISVAQDDDVIYVAAGTYLPTQQWGSTAQTKSIRFGADRISLRGGYPASPTGSESQDPTTHKAVLSGDLAQDDEPDGSDGFDENAFHVVSIIGAAEGTLMDGFVIERGNAASGGGSGDDIHGGGVYISHDFTSANTPCFGTVQNCEILLNRGRYGGGLVVDAIPPSGNSFSYPRATPSIRTSFLHDNYSWKGGGAMHWLRAAPEAAGCVITKNFCDYWAGGVAIEEPPEVGENDFPARLANCTVSFNSNSDANGDWGCGIYVIAAGEEGTVSLENCIVTSNITGEVDGDDDYEGTVYAEIAHLNDSPPGMLAFAINYSDIGNIDDPDNIPPASAYGTGNIGETDPLFVDVSGNDFRLQQGSACIDAGTDDQPSLPRDDYDADYDSNLTEALPDRDRAPRFVRCYVDMGAFESQCAADVDNDGTAGSSDLAILLGQWGSCSACCVGDLDFDGDVDSADLAAFLGAWGDCPELGDSPAPEQSSGSNSLMASEGAAALDPAGAASLLGFDSVEEFAAWLGTLDASSRDELLLGLLGGGA